MKRIALAGAVFAMMVFVVAASAMAQQGETQAPVEAGAGTQYVEHTDNGAVNWETGVMTAIGIGAPPANAVNTAQARGMAKRAATVIARRNLLELLRGVQINSDTTIKNFMVANDVVVSRIRGFLQNSQILDTAYMSDGSVEVTVGIRLRDGVADVLLPKPTAFRTMPVPQSGKEPEVEFATVEDMNAMANANGTADDAEAPVAEAAPAPALDLPSKPYTGLIVDARGLGLRPAMSPRILDEEGREVYGTALVKRDYAIRQGMAGYAKDVDMASANDRVGENPLYIPAVDIAGAAGTDVVISNKQAESIRAAKETPAYLAQCRVMFVLD